MALVQRDNLERYTDSSQMTDGILELFNETLSLGLCEEGDKNAQLGESLWLELKLEIVIYRSDSAFFIF